MSLPTKILISLSLFFLLGNATAFAASGSVSTGAVVNTKVRLAPPTSIEVIQRGTGTIINWVKPANSGSGTTNAIDYYKLFYRFSASGSYLGTGSTIYNNTGTTIIDLIEGSNYDFLVQAFTVDNIGSDSGTCLTCERLNFNIPTISLTMSDVTVSESSPTANRKPTWNWLTVSGSTAYRYSYDDSSWTNLGSGSTSFIPDSDLNFGTTYTLYVQVRSEAWVWSTSKSASVTIEDSVKKTVCLRNQTKIIQQSELQSYLDQGATNGACPESSGGGSSSGPSASSPTPTPTPTTLTPSPTPTPTPAPTTPTPTPTPITPALTTIIPTTITPTPAPVPKTTQTPVETLHEAAKEEPKKEFSPVKDVEKVETELVETKVILEEKKAEIAKQEEKAKDVVLKNTEKMIENILKKITITEKQGENIAAQKSEISVLQSSIFANIKELSADPSISSVTMQKFLEPLMLAQGQSIDATQAALKEILAMLDVAKALRENPETNTISMEKIKEMAKKGIRMDDILNDEQINQLIQIKNPTERELRNTINVNKKWIKIDEAGNAIVSDKSIGMKDSDNDGLSDALEIRYGTNPFNANTDGDGYSDGEEILDLGTNPLIKNTGEEISISNWKDGDISTAEELLIRGVAPAKSEVELVAYNQNGDKISLGKIKADESGRYVIKSTKGLLNGNYTIRAITYDKKGNIAQSSSAMKITIDKEMVLPSPRILVINDFYFEVEKISGNLTTPDSRLVVRGTTYYGSTVIANFQSLITSVSVIADTPEGDFEVVAPKDLAPGEHHVDLYALMPDGSRSETITIPFTVDPAYIPLSERKAKKESPLESLLYQGLAVSFATFGLGSYFYYRRKVI